MYRIKLHRTLQLLNYILRFNIRALLGHANFAQSFGRVISKWEERSAEYFYRVR